MTGGNPALASVGTNVTQRPMTGKPLFGDRIAAKTGAAAAGEPARQAKYVSPKKSADRIRDLAKSTGAKVMFRSKKYVENRTRFEIPHAFISHDSKDRATAQTIATYLQNRLCPVWYDEFSLSVGDNLRESIEKGLKESKKCILVLSRDFLSNPGWTKKEFDSIFTREILEQTRLILPVWLNVSTEDVFAYSPSLANVFALNWVELGEEEVCKKLHKAIV